MFADPLLEPTGVGYSEPFREVTVGVQTKMEAMIGEHASFGWEAMGGGGLSMCWSVGGRGTTVVLPVEGQRLVASVETYAALARSLDAIVASVSVPTGPYLERYRKSDRYMPGGLGISGGRIGRKSPYLKDIHWLTYLSAPYRALIPDSAIPVLRERFGFEEYPNGAFRFILLPDPYEAFARPDELEAARQDLLEAIGPALLQEVPTEVADAIGLRPPPNLH